MACITISGYPCSGKSRRAHQLKSYLEQRLEDPAYEGPKLNVSVVSDTDLNIDRAVYNDQRVEKPARAAYLTAINRRLSKDTLLILDGMNYIKGYRYQIYCAAREAGVRVCTVFVACTPEQAKEWHDARPAEERYDPATLDNLITRYEEPSSMVRWDSPLFTVAGDDEDVPGDAIWQAIMSGVKRPPNRATETAAKPPTDILHTLEQTTTSLVSLIRSAQQSLPSPDFGGAVNLPLSPVLKFTLALPNRNVTTAELQRLKRQFITAHKKAMSQSVVGRAEMDWSEGKIAEKFVDYLEENFNAS
ncbi:chromatin associated protein KTI12 [Dacryopinax primogenitus]|uniref:Chromatin associated protein KTI12 n=1 Tax=Dacryopinax primogenitus (strain DJM 731) TaxID=1858805 RepID=M5G168_DACPD|nr:chromatin associated protein KTI12 [Dacryopinax primogenitus]EJU01920.1 chromatin associated protein KTI12 [Dacryopinax primogenitus]